MTDDLKDKMQKEMWDYLQKILDFSDMWYQSQHKTFSQKQKEIRCAQSNGMNEAYNIMTELYNKWFVEKDT